VISMGWNRLGYFLDLDAEDWDYIININLKGSYFVCAEVGKHMVARGSGVIVN